MKDLRRTVFDELKHQWRRKKHHQNQDFVSRITISARIAQLEWVIDQIDKSAAGGETKEE